MNLDSLKQNRESRYLLNDYITRGKKKISINGVVYEVTLYQGKHENEYLLSEMKGSKVEGRCQLFNRGILSLAWMMKNGKRIGEITEYENGKALRRESWNSILGNDGGDRRMIENSKEGLIMTIRKQCDKERADDLVIYRGGFDKEMNRDGYGIEYDVENGKEKIEGYWCKDKLIRITREFDAESNKMIEYDNSNDENKSNEEDKKYVTKDMEILNRIPIYIGGYRIENGKFARHGMGYLIDEASGTAIRESEWENGKEKKEGGIDLHEGWYVKGMSESIRSVLDKKSLTKKLNEQINNASLMRIEIRNSSELNAMNLKVKVLVICSNSCKKLGVFDLNKYKSLQSIDIGDDCFYPVQTFKIDGLDNLKTLKIGKDSFSGRKTPNWNYEMIMYNQKSFHILNCRSLESIQIGEMSFFDFSGKFELKNLPQLKSIHIGEIQNGSSNFVQNSFVVKGIIMILNLL